MNTNAEKTSSDFRDDEPVSEFDWQHVKQEPNDPPHFTAGEVAKCGLIGVGLFALFFGLLALAMIYL